MRMFISSRLRQGSVPRSRRSTWSSQ
jgi:hypothetical protein